MEILNRRYVRQGFRRALLYVLLTAFVILCAFPLFWMLSSALQTEEGVFTVPPNLLPSKRTFSLQAFHIAVQARGAGDEHPVARWLLNSAFVASVSSVAAIALGLSGGYALSRYRFMGASITGFVILLTQMLPGSLMIIPMYMIMTDFGLTNSLWGLSLGYLSFHLPFSLWLLKGFFDGIPIDLEEQGLVDGCTRLGALWRITTPLILPGIVATFIFDFISSWGEYTFAMTLMDNVSRWTYSVGAASLQGEHQIRWTQIMAISCIGTLPVFILFLYMQRYLLAGLTAGGVKG